MAIQISPNGRLMTIQTNDSSYQMLADKNGVLLHLYYGSSIGAEDLSDLIVRSDVGFSGNPEEDRKSTRLNSSHNNQSRMPSSA